MAVEGRRERKWREGERGDGGREKRKYFEYIVLHVWKMLILEENLYLDLRGLPVKNSPNSCSSFMALSNTLLACSYVCLLFMSLKDTGRVTHCCYVEAEQGRQAAKKNKNTILDKTIPFPLNLH